MFGAELILSKEKSRISSFGSSRSAPRRERWRSHSLWWRWTHYCLCCTWQLQPVALPWKANSRIQSAKDLRESPLCREERRFPCDRWVHFSILCQEKRSPCEVYSPQFVAESTESLRTPLLSSYIPILLGFRDCSLSPRAQYPTSRRYRQDLLLSRLTTSRPGFCSLRVHPNRSLYSPEWERQQAWCTGSLSNRSGWGNCPCRVRLRTTQKWWRCKGSNRN